MAITALYDGDYLANRDSRNPGPGVLGAVSSTEAKADDDTIDTGSYIFTVLDDDTTDTDLATEGLNAAVDERVTVTQAAE